jgi:NAD(P)-dependent dehydrogenase (short-subunit alcohol dehydrogenase family)
LPAGDQALSAHDETRDKVALITGASGGLGLATALAFARRGASLALVDLPDRNAEKAITELECVGTTGGRIAWYAADVTDGPAVNDYFAQTLARFGRIDVVFNNAGIEGTIKSVTEYPDEMFDRVMRVNVRGVWLNLKAAINAMRVAGRGGSIVNTASGTALVGSPGASAYVASKHAVLGLTRCVAAEVAMEAIRVNAICPGPVDTRMMQSIEDQSEGGRFEAHRTIVNKIPMGRYGTPDEIAELVAYLASDAAAFITGAAIAIDGGLTSI